MKCIVLSAAAGLFLLFAAPASACSCASVGSFLELAPREQLVIRGRILQHTGDFGTVPTEMDVEVLETLAGRADKQVIRVSGDNGMLCRPYVSRFPIGTEWLLALGSAHPKWLDKGDYAISACGTFWLKVKDSRVSGRIRHEQQGQAGETLLLDEVRQRFAAARKKQLAAEENAGGSD